MKTKSISLPNFILLLLSFLINFHFISAQQTIDALDIEQKIKSGKDVSYENVSIQGILDLTTAREESGKIKKKIWSYDNTIEHTLDGDISFVNCIFEDHVYAYLNDKNVEFTDGNSNYTFVANFDGKVTFKNCTFKKRGWFKYSEFDQDSDFSGTSFEGSSTFKYAQFPEKVSFANTQYLDDSTFKYTEFSEFVSFENALFKEDAIFKYTKFEEGVSFNNTRFEDDLDLKYTDIDGEYLNDNMVVEGSMDTKYTKINGQKITKKSDW